MYGNRLGAGDGVMRETGDSYRDPLKTGRLLVRGRPGSRLPFSLYPAANNLWRMQENYHIIEQM